MKRTTRKLSGHAKDRFLRRFFESQAELSPAQVDQLTARSQGAFTSLRIRNTELAAVGRSRRTPTLSKVSQSQANQVRDASASAAVAPVAPAPTTETGSRDKPTALQASAVEATPFDPYCIGLVPVFQREGTDGLISRLQEIEDVAQLRQMAKVQKIVLPQDLRSGDCSAQTIRQAIADAVERRIADRRAAAG